ncbi:RidA family protein [Thermodesulforhabdus norvegica]|uniref:Endoribonuclease L-PSP n=1 Tax=Thermodesulforhabdus norvegica TaxID=39841 RepID=A0A1I4REV6_9BACT|nr:RidA family protein [Thermodesulforhabdus norvegica]SFM50759.1 endoribonuclease L-PSP [Thermodesulforhabdus norvegica]
MIRVILSEDAPAPVGPYSQAIRVNDMVFLSGQIGLNPRTGKLISEDVKDQTEQALKNIEALLRAEGLSLSSVVKVTVFLRDMNDFSQVNEVYAKFFPATPPARSCVAVSGLPLNAKVEIEAIAFHPHQSNTRGIMKDT